MTESQPPTKRQKVILEELEPLPRLPNPFRDGNQNGNGISHPRCFLEQKIIRISSLIRSKPRWYEKRKDENIVKKWKQELAEQEVEEDVVKYVFDELAYYDSLRDGAIEPAPVDGTWLADNNIPNEFKEALIAGIAKLENVDEARIDYHPGSDKQVIDLVHPSLFCLTSDISLKRTETDAELLENIKTITDCFNHIGLGKVESLAIKQQPNSRRKKSYYVSEKNQWLPSEVKVDRDGKAKIQSYINNLHPIKNSELYEPIERIFEKFVPMFNRVLTDMAHPRPPRIEVDPYSWYDDEGSQEENEDSQNEEEGSQNDDYDDDKRKERKLIHPDVPEFESPKAPKMITLQGRQLQVIVKLANIILTPEKPSYPGGVWHVEGMQNERIVASGIYYYKSENISKSTLAFRESVAEPMYEQGDNHGVSEIYGLENDEPLVQNRGLVEALEDRCICFPNTMQHHVNPFELEDKEKPGIRKILVYFLVDPSIRITSTLHVPPQQQSWYLEPLYHVFKSKLPIEVINVIIQFMNFPISLEQAKVIREDLMQERKFFVKENSDTFFERPFSLCEH
jgi:hypothetical protein